MIFQGQEFAASSPFLYFADHQGKLGEAVTQGRREFLDQFPSITDALRTQALDIPGDEATFQRSRLDHRERDTHSPVWNLHRTLIELRRNDPAFGAPLAAGVAGAVLGLRAFVLRFGSSPHGAPDRLLVVNLGDDVRIDIVAESLLAPGRTPWRLLWSSEDPAFGGAGRERFRYVEGWHVPAESAWVLG